MWENTKVWDHSVDKVDDHKQLMYQVRLKGTEYDLDNRSVYIYLKNATLGGKLMNVFTHSRD